MICQAATPVVLFLTVLMWTVQPHVQRAQAFADAADVCSTELDNEADSEKVGLDCVCDWATRVAAAGLSSARYTDETTGSSETCVLSLNHLRGPPAN